MHMVMRILYGSCVLMLITGCHKDDRSVDDPNAGAKSLGAGDETAGKLRNNMQSLSISVANFMASTGGTYPGVDRMHTTDSNPPFKSLGLSWRVHILPYIGERVLWEKFHRDEPWDSEHNRALLSEMPDLYRTPGAPEGKTSIHLFMGAGTRFENAAEPVRKSDVPDGPARTILYVLAGHETATEWTKPGGIEFDPQVGVALLGTPPTDFGFPITFFEDFSDPAFLPESISTEHFNALVLPSDGKGSQIVLNHIQPSLRTIPDCRLEISVNNKPMPTGTLVLQSGTQHRVQGVVTLSRSILSEDAYPATQREVFMNNASLELRIPDTLGAKAHQLDGKIAADGKSVTFDGDISGVEEIGLREGDITILDYAHPIKANQWSFHTVVLQRLEIEVQK